MMQALKQARIAFEKDEIPVGCVIVHNNVIIGKAHNQIKNLKDPTAHAEMIAITQAAEFLKNERLIGADVYVTKEPCAMCAGALVLARVKRLIIGTRDEKAGACGSALNVIHHKKMNHRIDVKKRVLEQECREILQDFFKGKRSKK
jgi:tRNA(adenine34) deaminase